MTDLNDIRVQIDEVDNKLLELLAKRLELVRKVGQYKKEHNLPIKDPAREEQILESLYEKGIQFKLPKEFIKKIWRSLFEQAYKEEE